MSNDPELKAIETRYAGCRFRSRLEARWAVFFDHLGISWEYEPEGFELPAGRYLPDFLLPELDAWVEVKGRLESSDVSRIRDFVILSNSRLILLGAIPRPHASGRAARHTLFQRGPSSSCVSRLQVFHLATIVPACEDRLCAYHQRLGDPELTESELERMLLLTPDRDQWNENPSVSNSYRVARSARFEHGESGINTRTGGN